MGASRSEAVESGPGTGTGGSCLAWGILGGLLLLAVIGFLVEAGTDRRGCIPEIPASLFEKTGRVLWVPPLTWVPGPDGFEYGESYAADEMKIGPVSRNGHRWLTRRKREPQGSAEIVAWIAGANHGYRWLLQPDDWAPPAVGQLVVRGQVVFGGQWNPGRSLVQFAYHVGTRTLATAFPDQRNPPGGPIDGFPPSAGVVGVIRLSPFALVGPTDPVSRPEIESYCRLLFEATQADGLDSVDRMKSEFREGASHPNPAVQEVCRRALFMTRSSVGGTPPVTLTPLPPVAAPIGEGTTPGQRILTPGGLELVWCPPRGPRPEDPGLPLGFWIGAYELTTGQVLSLPAQGSPDLRRRLQGRPGPLEVPAWGLTWEEAGTVLAALEERARGAGVLAPGWRYRLPTYEEWRHACGYGGELPEFERALPPAGTDPSSQGPFPVGSWAPNPLGLFDMVGNTNEWVYGGPGHERVYVGGSVKDRQPTCTTGETWRSDAVIESSGTPIGLRVVLGR